ncbi:hypothetical protein NDU88_001074 [Pleurodeles waltl]|uniref:Uncharacterized protein n=1 Tax=Pleurodeles waltl TaxID=8319 RepID=A0AAV7Q8P7_PLEWA|nr:hypothetical protein NDU88_001074 [Pleurodeles waltl]
MVGWARPALMRRARFGFCWWPQQPAGPDRVAGVRRGGRLGLSPLRSQQRGRLEQGRALLLARPVTKLRGEGGEGGHICPPLWTGCKYVAPHMHRKLVLHDGGLQDGSEGGSGLGWVSWEWPGLAHSSAGPTGNRR